MKSAECEEIILSAMAESDGEPPLFSAERKARHLSRCEQCRIEIERQTFAANALQKQKRRAEKADLWSGIEQRINEKTVSEPFAQRHFFLLLGAILVIYKLLEMIPARDFGFLFKFLPLIFIVALFYLLKENPFKINTELKLEG
ncbi:MAG TPA: hypothetical protein VK400_03775 [Pyrinomonadaceae bacterium]|nr:hypothetical protein [Pyrinomonadaceae bacterium]